MRAVAIDLDGALGDTRPLLADWRADAARRLRVDGEAIEREVPNWASLLERFAEERAPVYLRPDSEVSAILRKLQAEGVRVGVFTDAPEPLARVALAQLGATRRIDALETGPDALARLLTHLGRGATVIRTRAELIGLR